MVIANVTGEPLHDFVESHERLERLVEFKDDKGFSLSFSSSRGGVGFDFAATPWRGRRSVFRGPGLGSSWHAGGEGAGSGLGMGSGAGNGIGIGNGIGSREWDRESEREWARRGNQIRERRRLTAASGERR